MIDVLLLLVGFVLLIVGADKLVAGASALARRFQIPDIVIGLTIVAFGTSAPEFVVSFIAALNQNTEMVLGNVVGSNIFNVLGVLGVAVLFAPLTVQRSTIWIGIPLSFLSALVLLVLASDAILDFSTNQISRTDSLMLLFFFLIFMVYNMQVAKSSKEEIVVEGLQLSTLKTVLFIVGGFAGLILGGNFIVESAVSIAQKFGISERIIALTIVSIGTSLPELATSVMAVRRKNADIAIGNVVGSNIFNVFFILGASAFITPFAVQPSTLLDLLVNLLASGLLFVFLFTGGGRKLDRWEGVVFLAMYVAYVSNLIFGFM